MARFSRVCSVLEREAYKKSIALFVHRQPVEEFRSIPNAEKYGAAFVHDLFLASLFFAVVFSPFAINAWQDWMEDMRLWRGVEGEVRGIDVDGALVE